MVEKKNAKRKGEKKKKKVQLSICPRKWHTKTPMGLWHSNGSPNLGQKTRFYIINKIENWQNCRLWCLGWPQNKTERKWKEG